MAKFKDDNLDLETGEHIDFDDADTIQMGYDGTELYINSTVSGIRAAQPHQMVRYDQLTETSGVLQDQVDDNMHWRGNWLPVLYDVNDVVLDASWLMIANKETYEHAAPQPNGDPTYGVDDAPTWSYLDDTSVIHSGHVYTFTEGGWLQRVRAWVPELTSTTHYRFIMMDITNPQIPAYTVIQDPLLIEDEWIDIAARQIVVTSGTVLKMYIDALDSGANSVVTGGWTYGGTSNNNGPADKSWNRDNQHNTVRIDYTDLDSIDRKTEILGITSDSTLLFAQTDDSSKFVEYTTLIGPVETATYAIFYVQLIDSGVNIDSLATTTFTATVPIAQSTEYVEAVNYWSSNPLDYATISGFVAYDGVDQPGKEDNAYGIDLFFQKAYVSPDWDFMATSDTVGGGAGSQSDEFVELLDTPTTYSGYAGSHVMVKDSENGLEFVTEPPGTVISGTVPPDNNTSLWYNSNDDIIYYWDETRMSWLSTSIINYLFTYSGNIDGLYLSVGNVVDSYAHYNMTRPAAIVSISADQNPTGSLATKGYDIIASAVTVYSFNMVNDTYSNTNLNVELDQSAELQMFCVAAGARARDPIINLELRWRYEA